MYVCDKHFIKTIRGGLSVKVCNMDNLLRPALSFKTLTDVYESEAAKRPRCHCIINSHNMDLGSVHDSCQGKSEITCLSMADRSLHEIKPKTEKFFPCSDNESGSDLDDDTTLKQLKERSKAKKRKFSYGEEYSSQADANRKPVKDESDLYEPLIRLKSRNSKAKRKFTSKSIVVSSTIAFAVKSEQNLVSEGSLQVSGELAPVIHVKVEAPEAEQLGCRSTTSFADDSCIGDNRGSSSCGVASSEFQKMLQHNNREPLLLEEEYQNCVTNEISYDHLEDIEPNNMLFPLDVKVEYLELSCPEFLVLPPSSIQKGKEIKEPLACSDYQSADVGSSSSSMEEISDQSDISGIQVSDMATDDNVVCMGCDQEMSFNQLEDRAETRFPCKQDDLLTSQESSPDKKAYDWADTFSTNKPQQHPERLLSTRTAISPSSQEQLRLAMDSVELCNDANKFIDSESKELIEKQIGKKASSADIQHHAGRMVDQKKVILSPREIIKKSKNTQGNLEGPRFSRSLPNLSTGCASIRGCSESAIAFSQRQMHDMESLAGKLMSELKSMKDIVEQKLLFEAYRNVSLKNDADEVKLAIDNTVKVEETARKWLNMMSRDCNRFCKIMKLTSNSTATSKDGVPKERKKIKFADEEGGELCHVKFYEDMPTPPVSESVKQ